MSDHTIAAFTKGTQNLISPELIPTDAAQESRGWFTKDGKIVLSYGRALVGNESSGTGKISGIWFGYKTDGSKVMYRKISTKIQYLNVATWTDIITGLTSNADYTFANYSSLSGAFTFVGGIDGIWKIINANPGSPINMAKLAPYKGKILIDRARITLWDSANSKTTLFLSRQDQQKDGVQYTTVTGEATTSLTGTLAFKAGGATRNCYGIVLTLTGTGEVFTDNRLGALTGTLGGTGTINYATGAYTLSNSGVGTASYKWEDSNSLGLTDFTASATRLAGEANIIQQAEGGDSILNVLIGQDGHYYSEKSNSFYDMSISTDDLTFNNVVYRKDLGILSFRGGISSNKGIVFMNTANVAKPEMTILQRSLVDNNIEPVILFPHYKFSNFDYTDCCIDTWERYITVLCKTLGAIGGNDTILLCDIAQGTVDAISYAGRCSAKNNGNLYVGSPLTENVYQLFVGFDDDGIAVSNYWTGKNDQYQMAIGLARQMRYQIGERLKKYRRQKVKGMISPSQTIQIYADADGSGFQLIGTILGTGSYVDYSSPNTIGTMIGGTQIGGDDTAVVAYPFFTEFAVHLPYFRTRTLKLVATGIGYADVQFISDWDIIIGVERLPSRFRQKQHVSIDGLTTDIASI